MWNFKGTHTLKYIPRRSIWNNAIKSLAHVLTSTVVKLSLKLWHRWVITSHIKLWMPLCIHALFLTNYCYQNGPLVTYDMSSLYRYTDSSWPVIWVGYDIRELMHMRLTNVSVTLGLRQHCDKCLKKSPNVAAMSLYTQRLCISCSVVAWPCIAVTKGQIMF